MITEWNLMHSLRIILRLLNICTVLVVGLLIGSALTACGSAQQTAVSRSAGLMPSGTGDLSMVGPHGYVENDDDDDDKGRSHDPDDGRLWTLGRPATKSERGAIQSLAQRFFDDARTGETARACELIVPQFARSTKLAAAVPPAYLPAPGSLVFHHQDCMQVEAQLFQLDHERLVAESPTVKAISIRVAGDRALVLLGFRTTSERELNVQHSGGTWKIDGLLDGEVP